MTKENFIDRKVFIPQEIHKIKLRKGETLVWGLDYEQYKLVGKEKVEELMGIVQAGLKRQFPNNKIIVTIGKTELTTISEEPPSTE